MNEDGLFYTFIVLIFAFGIFVGWGIWGQGPMDTPTATPAVGAPVKSPYTAREDYEYCVKQEFDKEYCYKTHITKEK